jgi:hypothetical protein
MPNEILAIFDADKKVEVSYSHFPGFAHVLDGEGLRDGAVDWDFLAKKYGTGDSGGVYIGFESDGSPRRDNNPTWQEINFSSSDPDVTERDGKYHVFFPGQRLDSYSIQAMRRGKLKPTDTYENAVQIMPVKDGKLILTERGGSDLAGKLQPAGGSCTYQWEYQENPIIDTAHHEARDEMGATLQKAKIYGIFNQVGVHINRQTIVKAEPVETMDELLSELDKGRELHHRWKHRTGDEAIARQALIESPFPNDAWESRVTHLFAHKPETYLRLLSNPSWEGRPLIDTLVADLYVLGTVDFGPEWAKEAEKLNLVQEKVVKI